MPPQPLSSVRRDVRIIAGACATIFRPSLARLAAEAIAHWADIESQFGGILVTMLGTQAPPASAMFFALTSSSAKWSALGAAAEVALGEGSRDLEMLEVVIEQAKKAALHRNRFAHWCWAHSPDIPDALLFIDPEALVAHDIASGTHQAPHNGRGLLATIDRAKVYVYREKDLTEAVKSLDDVSYCVSRSSDRAHPSNADGAARRTRAAISISSSSPRHCGCAKPLA
jgi:hypothetical protein